MRFFYVKTNTLKKIKLPIGELKLFPDYMEINFTEGIHIDEEVLFQLVSEKIKYYKENPIPVVILRKSSADKYSINPTLFVEHKEFFEAHAKWVAVVASDDSGFENLEYLKQLTNVPGYGFTNYHKVLELLKKENKLL